MTTLMTACDVQDCCNCCSSIVVTSVLTSDGLAGLTCLALSVSAEQELTEAPTFGSGSCGGPGGVIDEGMDEDAFVAALLDA